VQDSGIGITLDDQKKLFQKFFRADNSSTREAGGTGLGLVIAKTTVELLGGAIWVESERGRGSRFYFTLPLSPEAEAAQVASPAVPLPERGIGLVLVVDDDNYVRGIVQHFLHRRGYGTLGASTGGEGLQKARLHKPDVITLDLMMPGREGFEVLRALKTDPATASIPVVLISIAGDPARGVLSLGAFSIVQKPLSEARLLQTIGDAVGLGANGGDGEGAQPWASVLYAGVLPPGDGPNSSQSGVVAALAARGIALHVAEQPAEALAYAVTSSPELIMLDMAAPDTFVFEFVGALKAEEEAARIPIIMLTDDIADTGIHFHLGSDIADNTLSLEYIGEQLGRILAVPVK